jgi:hypothetical protein
VCVLFFFDGGGNLRLVCVNTLHSSFLDSFLYVGHTSSEVYSMYLLVKNSGKVPSESSTKSSSNSVFVSWCQRSIPNCLLVFIMPVIGTVLFFIILVFIVIVVKIVKKRRMLEKRKDVIAPGKVPIISYRRAIAKPLPPIPTPKTSPSAVKKERSYITCNQQFCDSIARYYCWTCRFYVCNKHKISHSEDDGHDLARVMVCDVCKNSKRISLQKVEISMHKARYLCDRCLNKYASEVEVE